MQARHESIFRVTGDGVSKAWGTAFVAHSDDAHTYLVTCAHVIADVGGRCHVLVGGQRADVVACGGEEDIDVAVVRIPRIENAPFLLGRKIVGGGCFCTTGFSNLYGGYYRKGDLRGTFGRVSEILGNRSSKGHRTWELRVEGKGKFGPGLNGSPVVSETTGKCVGIVIASQQGEGHGISIDAIGEIYPEVDDWLPEAGAFNSSGARMDLEEEVAAFQRIALEDDLETRVILIQAPSGMGKSRLLDEYQQIAKTIDLPSKRINLRQQTTVDLFLREISAWFGNLSRFDGFKEILKMPRSLENIKELHRIMGVSLCSLSG